MARSVGGHIPGPTLAVTPESEWADPAVGNLVDWDTGGNHMVDECGTGDEPLGQVIAINPSRTVLTVELFTGGMVAVLPYDGEPALGDAIEAEGSTDANGTGKVQPAVSGGVGRVVGVDRVPGYVDVYFG